METLQTERRETSDRRSGRDRRGGRDRRHVSDREWAKRLPDDFAQAGGAALDRIVGLVSRYWLHYDAPVRRELTQALLPILEELLQPGTAVTDRHRRLCEEVVLDWAARH